MVHHLTIEVHLLVRHLTIEGHLQVRHLAIQTTEVVHLAIQVTWVTEAHLLVVRHQTEVLQVLHLQEIYLVITLSDQEDDKYNF